MLSWESFWWVTTITCVVWFSTVTAYVAVRGGQDIKQMLARLNEAHARESRGDSEPGD